MTTKEFQELLDWITTPRTSKELQVTQEETADVLNKCTEENKGVTMSKEGIVYRNLDKYIKRLKWYLNEIRDEELKELDVDYDEYEAQCTCTEYSNIITLVEEALEERPVEDCRYKESPETTLETARKEQT